MPSLEKTYAAGLPATEGHFPGNPIIPGAWLLADALAAAAGELGISVAACTVKNAKFMAPARPGQTVQIVYTPGESGLLKLECRADGAPVLSAQISCPPSPPQTTA
ncbi:MAG TPA: 3-hydroxyacyl-ACP dehydratase [Burkholderiales bacterium]|jgi:3-hydroxymyristoyl/3-hydroxydecanoyl-(acyl carrier protein) dehydratase